MEVMSLGNRSGVVLEDLRLLQWHRFSSTFISIYLREDHMLKQESDSSFLMWKTCENEQQVTLMTPVHRTRQLRLRLYNADFKTD